MSRRAFLFLGLAAGLAGCFRLSTPSPQVYSYQLSYDPPSLSGAPLSAVLRIAPVRVASVYDREAIVYRDGSFETGTYFYHRWATTPGSMITDLLGRDFASSGLYRAVEVGPSFVPSDYQLDCNVEVLEESVASNGCRARLRIRATLLRASGGAGHPVLLQAPFEAEEPCASNEPRDLVAAMSRAMSAISAEMQQRVRDAIEKAPRH